MAVVGETWYTELKDQDTFYTKVTSLKLLDHLKEFCAGLHTMDAVDIPHIIKSIYKDSEGVPQFIMRWRRRSVSQSARNSLSTTIIYMLLR